MALHVNMTFSLEGNFFENVTFEQESHLDVATLNALQNGVFCPKLSLSELFVPVSELFVTTMMG